MRTWRHDILRHRIDEACAHAHWRQAEGEIRMAIWCYERDDLQECERWIHYAEWMLSTGRRAPGYEPISFGSYMNTYQEDR